jgi:hypothetical protein
MDGGQGYFPSASGASTRAQRAFLGEVTMLHTLRLPAFLTTALVVAALAQSPSFKGGFFTATPTDGTPPIGLEFDTSGAINVYVDNQPFSKSSWETKRDTMLFGPVVAPEGYACANGATYLWALADSVLSFTLLKDDCDVRSNALVNLVWKKG